MSDLSIDELRAAMEKLPPPVTDPKPGYLTSEFGAFAGVFLAAVLNNKLGLNIPPTVIGGVVVTAITYIYTRLKLKLSK